MNRIPGLTDFETGKEGKRKVLKIGKATSHPERVFSKETHLSLFAVHFSFSIE